MDFKVENHLPLVVVLRAVYVEQPAPPIAV